MNERVWVVDDDQAIRWVLEKALQKAKLAVRTFSNANAVLKALERDEPDALVTDIRMPEMDGLTLLEQLRRQHTSLPVIVMTAHSDLDSAVSAYQGGAFEYLPKPFDIDDAVTLVRRACATRNENQPKVRDAPELASDIIGESPAMQDVFRAIGRLSHSNINVLITGESGTGKELVAQALHKHSPRASAPFIALNMAAIPRDLLESELFGHEKGSFTGAHAGRKGRFEQANHGTLFLDEIGDMPAEMQTRLLRVLSDGVFYKVGGHEPIQVDVRIVAATHQHLERLVQQGLFREDLYHRLNVIKIQLPPVRSRREDIPLLTRYFLKRAAQELKVEAKAIRPDVLEHLARLEWPGNVRQLQNTCRWLTVMAAGREILFEDLPPDLIPLTQPEGVPADTDWTAQLVTWANRRIELGATTLLDEATPLFEETMIRLALRHTHGRRQDAARLLGWGRNTLTRKIKELALNDLEGGDE